jgi:hypothetical protein
MLSSLYGELSGEQNRGGVEKENFSEEREKNRLK